jgi:hypothetical protein
MLFLVLCNKLEEIYFTMHINDFLPVMAQNKKLCKKSGSFSHCARSRKKIGKKIGKKKTKCVGLDKPSLIGAGFA